PDRWDLSALRSVTSSGVSFSPGIKHALLEHLPGLTIIDTLGASEGMGPSNSSRADGGAIDPSRFRVSERVAVLDERTGEPVTPGSDQIGLVAMGGHIPVGYYNDPEKTAATFRVVNGVRYAVPGDYATVAADGTVQLLGRGSASVNTGGEKVYPEEVESVLRKHKGVFDCAIVGVPDPRFGEVIVGVVQVTPNHYLDGPELTAFCRRKLASSKMPREWIFVDSLERSAAGKVDHPKLRALAMERLGLR
ncbi:MAG: acyl-CoA synthetase, partial [Acidimicrobiia bacterium]